MLDYISLYISISPCISLYIQVENAWYTPLTSVGTQVHSARLPLPLPLGRVTVRVTVTVRVRVWVVTLTLT